MKLTELSGGYGQGDVVRTISVDMLEGEILAVLGPNGAGKTTLACLIAGHLTPSGGQIDFDGRDITDMTADRRARAGVAHVPQGRRIFANLTVAENLEVAQFAAGRRTKPETRDFVREVFPKLEELRGRKGGVLSGGEQQMLAVARAILCEPRLILLDEPSLGLAPKIVEEMYDAFVKIRDRGVAILLAEQSVTAVMRVANRIAVLENGHFVRLGEPGQFADDNFIASSYLGSRANMTKAVD